MIKRERKRDMETHCQTDREMRIRKKLEQRTEERGEKIIEKKGVRYSRDNRGDKENN